MNRLNLIFAYTIIELLVVMTVLGILATAALPLVELSAKRNKERELKASLWEIRHAIDAYKTAYDTGRLLKQAGASGYPPSLQILTQGVPDLQSNGQRLVWLRRLPKDPFAPNHVSAEQSWGLRSYISTAADPKPGADVFDVYSQSGQIGMNGTPYRSW